MRAVWHYNNSPFCFWLWHRWWFRPFKKPWHWVWCHFVLRYEYWDGKRFRTL